MSGGNQGTGTGSGISLYVADHFIGQLSSIIPEKPSIQVPDPSFSLAFNRPEETMGIGQKLQSTTNRFGEENSALSFNEENALFPSPSPTPPTAGRSPPGSSPTSIQ